MEQATRRERRKPGEGKPRGPVALRLGHKSVDRAKVLALRWLGPALALKFFAEGSESTQVDDPSRTGRMFRKRDEA